MTDVIINRDASLSEIVPLFVGYEKCKPSHSFGPHRRNYYIIHFCLSGKGTLQDGRGEHKVKAGELFVIRKGETTVYFADSRDPWEYLWIAFDGTQANFFDRAESVYSAPAELTLKLKEYTMENVKTPRIYVSLIFELMHTFFERKIEKSDVISSIKRYIEYNYMDKITVADIARTYSFERTYLYKLFKVRYGIGIKEFIIDERIKNAKRFLAEGISVSECAHMVGYTDEFNFSRAFKSRVGVAPREWSKINLSSSE